MIYLQVVVGLIIYRLQMQDKKVEKLSFPSGPAIINPTNDSKVTRLLISLLVSMRFWLLFVLATVSFAYSINDHIVEFDDTSLQLVLEQANHSLIYFYSDSCKYCREFEPNFNYISVLYNNLTKESVKPFQVIKINARKNKVTSKLFNIQQYPTLKLLDFDTKKITHYDRKGRNLETIIEFIEEYVPDVSPNYNNYQSEVGTFDVTDISNTLVVFTMSFFDDWNNHYFPTHFYQRLAASYKKSMKFTIVEVDKLDQSTILQKYLINSFPSMIYFSESRFKTFQTYGNSQNNLGEEDIKKFIENLDTDSTGTWFNSVEDLENLKVVQEEPEVRMGFNINKAKNLDLDEEEEEEEEYDSLLDHIEL